MGTAQIGITTILNGRVMQRLELSKERILVGRSSECDVCIDHSGVSRSHAVLMAKSGSFFVEDLESSNGTLLNGVPTKFAELHNGDILGIGQFSLHIGIIDRSKGERSARAAMRREEQTVPFATPRTDASPSAPAGGGAPRPGAS